MTATLEDVVNRSFDYIIVGGGTAGLTLAARLVADEAKANEVLVLEAGEANLDDPDILKERRFGLLFEKDKLAYRHKWIKQKHAADRVGVWERGKGLGGSSAINYMAWFRPPQRDYDDWSTLTNNQTWTFANILPRINRIEGLVPEVPKLQYIDLEESKLGREGPVKLAIGEVGEGEGCVLETFRNDGVEVNRKAYNGDPTGCYVRPFTLDPETNTRSYAATAFYKPNAHRKNLTVLVTAVVRRVFLSPPDANGEVTATGVEFSYGSSTGAGEVYSVKAKKEVVLSAGTLTSPQILELSGIGRRDVLTKIDIPIKVELPGVGENLQEHIYAGVTYELAEGKGTFSGRTGVVANLPLASLPIDPHRPEQLHKAILRIIEDLQTEIAGMQDGDGADVQVKKGLLEQYKLLAKKHSPGEGGSPGFQWIVSPMFDSFPKKPEPGKRYATMRLVFNHGLSRGTIHSISSDPLVPPEIDPRYLSKDIDLDMMYEHFLRMRRIASHAPFKDIITKEVNPGPEVQTEEDIKEWIRKSFVTIYHTVGTCSMLPREKGGVVSPELKVYGTTNLRVVDVSIVPLHVGANTLSTAYGIGEIAADIILGKWPSSSG